MNLLIISGFLGAGKPFVLLPALQRLRVVRQTKTSTIATTKNYTSQGD